MLKVMARWASPKEVIVAGDARTTYYLHLLCALAQRHEVVTLSGEHSMLCCPPALCAAAAAHVAPAVRPGRSALYAAARAFKDLLVHFQCLPIPSPTCPLLTHPPTVCTPLQTSLPPPCWVTMLRSAQLF